MTKINAILFIGSNWGNRRLYLSRARRAVSRWPRTRILKTSRILQTAPEEFLHQRPFLNQALCIRTELKPFPLLLWAKKTEIELGRKKRPRNHPREIDIDILTYGRLRLHMPFLIIPHHRLHNSPSIQACLRDLK